MAHVCWQRVEFSVVAEFVGGAWSYFFGEQPSAGARREAI
jgi:hypothetical protein